MLGGSRAEILIIVLVTGAGLGGWQPPVCHRTARPMPPGHTGVGPRPQQPTVETAARELDFAVADVYQSDPDFAAPPELWDRLSTSLPTLLGPGSA
ncbi:hypothetical protein GCM10009800_46600 [Nocardiopsis rhodophaea]